jgi:hypothetical protein
MAAPVNAQDADAWCTSLRSAVAKTQSVMGQIAKSCELTGSNQAPAPPVAPMPNPSLTNLDELRELRKLLKAADMHALAVHEQLQLHHDKGQSADFKRLSLAMAAFDFAQAAQICDTLIEPAAHG